MHTNNQKAFTMVELIFVIVIIGILSAIAIPKLSSTVHQAHLTKAKTVLASVRSALSTERQKRILRGLTGTAASIDDLGDTADTNIAFGYFDGNASGTRVLQYPVKSCSVEACWQRNTATTYTYHISGTETANFTLGTNNRLDCSDSDTAQCDKISQ